MWPQHDEFVSLTRRFRQAELPSEKRRLRDALARMVLSGRVRIDPAFERNLQAAQDRVQQTACPIYDVDGRDHPSLLGSAVLLRVESRLFLLTAAHVLDRNRQSTLYVPGRDGLIPLEGSSGRPQEPLSGRAGDKLDFGFVMLRDTMQEELVRFRILTPEDIDVNDFPAINTLYGFVGFPATQNKPLPGRHLQLSTTIYSVLPKPDSDYAAPQLHPAWHFLGDFDRGRLVDRQKRLVTGPDPHGMSGGGVWRLGRFDELQSGGNAEKLIGIAIEYRKGQNALIGVRISFLTESLIHWYPDLVTLLPRPQNLRVNVTSACCA